MTPEEKNAAVSRALREAFGATDFEAIRAIPTGLTSTIDLHIVVAGSPFVLRIITRSDSMTDPARQFTCMSAAAEAGFAPRVRYASIEDGISITDSLETVPFPETEAAAHVNDRYFDLAVIANFVVANDSDERIFLQEYFGQPPDAYQRARFFLMRMTEKGLLGCARVVRGDYAGYRSFRSASCRSILM